MPPGDVPPDDMPADDVPPDGRPDGRRGGAPDDGLSFVLPSSRAGVAVRVVILMAFLVGWAFALTQPATANVGDLVQELEAGVVDTMRLEQTGPATEGTFEVAWTGADGAAFARYTLTADGVDWGQLLRETAQRSPSWVAVSEGEVRPPVPGKGIVVATSLFALGVLLLGPEPRLATTWGWWWLAAALTPLWLVFLLLEPTPLWRRHPVLAPRVRLGGAVAAVLAVGAAVAGWVWLPEWANIIST